MYVCMVTACARRVVTFLNYVGIAIKHFLGSKTGMENALPLSGQPDTSSRIGQPEAPVQSTRRNLEQSFALCLSPVNRTGASGQPMLQKRLFVGPLCNNVF